MPAFDAETLNGNPLHSTAYHGNMLVVTFVGADCKPCEQSLASAQAAYSDDRDLVVIGVFQETGAESAMRTAAKLALKFPVVVDQAGLIAKRFQVHDVPRTFVVDTHGRVRWVGGAELTEEALISAVQTAD